MGIAAGAVAGTVIGVKKMPNTVQHLKWIAKHKLKGSPRSPEASADIKRIAQEKAQKIVSGIKKQGLDPSKARIAVIGLSGSGKTTLAKEIAGITKGRHVNLDEATLRKSIHGQLTKGWNLRGYVNKNPIPPGGVYDHWHLVNKVDPKHYDVAVFIDPAKEVLEKRLRSRGRGAYFIDYSKVGKIKSDLNRAFNSLGGVDAPTVGDTRIKVSTRKRPFMGFASSPAMTRDRLITSMGRGSREKQGPIGRYTKIPKIVSVVTAPAVGGAAGYGIGTGIDKFVQHKKEKKASFGPVKAAFTDLAATLAKSMIAHPVTSRIVGDMTEEQLTSAIKKSTIASGPLLGAGLTYGNYKLLNMKFADEDQATISEHVDKQVRDLNLPVNQKEPTTWKL